MKQESLTPASSLTFSDVNPEFFRMLLSRFRGPAESLRSISGWKNKVLSFRQEWTGRQIPSWFGQLLGNSVMNNKCISRFFWNSLWFLFLSFFLAESRKLYSYRLVWIFLFFVLGKDARDRNASLHSCTGQKRGNVFIFTLLLPLYQ